MARSGPSSFRLTGVCRDLSPLPPPLPSSLPLFCPLGVFLNVILRFTPLSHWCVPGRFSWEHLSSSFSFPSLSFLLPFLSLLLVWVSLDAFVIAGNPSRLFFWCVLGRLCHSWEHLLPLSSPFLSSLAFSLLSLPLPPVGTLEWDATRGSWPYC